MESTANSEQSEREAKPRFDQGSGGVSFVEGVLGKSIREID